MFRPSIESQSPTRRPQWRLDRVMQMIRHRPRPLEPRMLEEDHNVRAYRALLLRLANAGDDEVRRDAVIKELPALYHAHQLHYCPDEEHRQILEARLLTDESFAEIARRFSTKPATIEYYEALFFNVRDRFENSDWIRKVIRGTFREGQRHSENERRGYVLRLFAFYGGPLALDATINGIIETKLPKDASELEEWFKTTLSQLVCSTAAAAASTLEMNQKNMLQTIKLALRASAASKHEENCSEVSESEMTARIWEAMESINNATEGKD